MNQKTYPPTWNRAYPYEDLHEYTGYHVIIKVHDQSSRLFPRSRDAYYYLKKLRKNLALNGCQLIEYMTMKTHLHFLALTPDGLEPLIRAIQATNISYGMHLRYTAKRSQPTETDMGLIDRIRATPDMKIFQKHNVYIPIIGHRHLLIELRYIKRNPENAHLLHGDKFLSSRREYEQNHFEFIDKDAILKIAGLFALTPHELHRKLMVDDQTWILRIGDLLPPDITGEQQLFKIPQAKFPLYTFSFPDESHTDDEMDSC